MKYMNSDGHERELEIIPNSSYYSDRDGDLYEIDYSTGRCWIVEAREALESILMRHIDKIEIHCHKENKAPTNDHARFKGHNKNTNPANETWLNQIWDKWENKL